MPIHVVYKEASTTTKVRAVFDASAKSSSGMSLNDTLMVGPTVHSQLVDEVQDPQSGANCRYSQDLGYSVGHQVRLVPAFHKQLKMVNKRLLLSDVARVFDALRWFSPATISMKILLQRLWELKVGWDDQVPSHILEKWEVWRSELPLLTTKHLERCYYLKEDTLEYTELHGFSDASEEAYAAVAYMRSVYTSGRSHVSSIMAKTKVAPLKRQSIPRLELCGALMLSRLLQHIKEVLQIPTSRIHAWTDSTIVLGWLSRRFKTFVGNQVSEIMDTLPPDCWRHVPTKYNPADCASRGVTPAELLQHELWWEGPPWLKLDSSSWPITERQQCQEDTEELKITLTSVTKSWQY